MEDDFDSLLVETAPADLLEDTVATARLRARESAMQGPTDNEYQEFTEQAAEFAGDGPKRSKRAKQYEDKAADILRFAMRLTAESPATVADAAAIVAYGDDVSEKLGDLAAEDVRVARMIDFINGGTENPYLNVAMVAMPLVLQVIRNHEMEVETSKTFRIFRREFKIPFKLQLKNKILRKMTHRPKDMVDKTFVPEVRAAMQKQGINVAAFRG